VFVSSPNYRACKARVPYSIVICALLAFRFRSFATTGSQLKNSDFSGEVFKRFEVLYFSMNAATTQLLSSGKFYKLRYDNVPVQSVSANVTSIPITQECQILNCDTLVAKEEEEEEEEAEGSPAFNYFHYYLFVPMTCTVS
jgi:hypothetical protein